MNLKQYRRRLDLAVAEHEHLTKVQQEESDRLVEEQQELEHAQQAGEILQQLSVAVQEAAHQQVAAIVSNALEIVFDEPYVFQIHFERKRGKTEARMVFVRDGLEVDPLSAAGGGVVDVAAFALRLACLVLSRPQLRRFIVLDEPFKFLSHEYRSRLRQLLTTLSEELDCQFLIVTHLPDLELGEVIEL